VATGTLKRSALLADGQNSFGGVDSGARRTAPTSVVCDAADASGPMPPWQKPWHTWHMARRIGDSCGQHSAVRHRSASSRALGTLN
jgi:hypothetical protein